MNCPDQSVADEIITSVMKEQFAASANSFPVATSYWLKGKPHLSNEIQVVFKTVPWALDEIAGLIRSRYPFEARSIIGSRVASVDPEYAASVKRAVALPNVPSRLESALIVGACFAVLAFLDWMTPENNLRSNGHWTIRRPVRP